MIELSLHLLDVVENSLRAGASAIRVSVGAEPSRDRLELRVEDNGRGLAVSPEAALDPFYTTKQGKRTGLGLSLFQAAAEQAGGGLSLGVSELGGLLVAVEMGLNHVDRAPLGDLAATLSSLVFTNPEMDFTYCFRVAGEERVIKSADLARGRGDDDHGAPLARRVYREVQRALEELGFPVETKIEWRKEEGMAEQKCCNCEQVSESELLKRLEEVLSDYRDKPGALIPVLQITQGIFGYLPEVALKRIARGLNKSYSEVAGVVGFYSFFTTVPRGRHLIRVCLGTACYVRGGKKVLDTIKKNLAIDVCETTPDRMFSLEIARCFGACGLAPTITIDDEVYQRVKTTKLPELLSQYRSGQAA